MEGYYYYIDESGNLFNDESIFIHGCIKTDTKDLTENILIDLKKNIKEQVYYTHYLEDFERMGFHATENHPDIKAELYKILPYMNFRAYFVIINKKSEFYKNLNREIHNYEIFEKSLRKLIKDRIKSIRGKAKNKFVFEEISIPTKSLNQMLQDYFSDEKMRKYNCDYRIAPKNEENLAIIDYLNYIIYTILTKGSLKTKMEENFDLIKEKIGSINILHNDVFLSRRSTEDKQINLNNLIEYYNSGN